MKKLITFIALLTLAACQSVSPSQQTELPALTTQQQYNTQTPIAGGVETLYIHPIKMPFHARMDTGAETSSIDAQNLRPFERDGEKWIAFDIINRKSNISHHFEKPINRRLNIIRTGIHERRYAVMLNIKMGNELINAEFTLNDRNKFDYQVLIGRNIINGRVIIDPTLENTMH